jgi:hypothetical protein
MAMNQKQNRPAGPPPSGKKKEKMDSVFASGADGTVYEIPKDAAKKYELTEDRARTLGDVPIIPQSDEGGDEVGGRHRVWLQDGTYRYHSDWLSGPYLWHADWTYYNGPHWHPNVNSPIAYDLDD